MAEFVLVDDETHVVLVSGSGIYPWMEIRMNGLIGNAIMVIEKPRKAMELAGQLMAVATDLDKAQKGDK